MYILKRVDFRRMSLREVVQPLDGSLGNGSCCDIPPQQKRLTHNERTEALWMSMEDAGGGGGGQAPPPPL